VKVVEASSLTAIASEQRRIPTRPEGTSDSIVLFHHKPLQPVLEESQWLTIIFKPRLDYPETMHEDENKSGHVQQDKSNVLIGESKC